MKQLAKLLSKDGLPFTFIVFYTVGLGLFFIPFTHNLFLKLIPYSLVGATAAILYYHQKWNIKTLAILFFIFSVSIIAEIIGVATGKLFGEYQYLSSLGIKIYEVPVMIGVNWIVLVYGSNAILAKFTKNSILKILGASSLMIVYDIVLEKAAPIMHMWIFKDNQPPLKNYLIWFLLAILFHLVIEIFKINTSNKPARALFIIQLFFFAIIVSCTIFLIK